MSRTKRAFDDYYQKHILPNLDIRKLELIKDEEEQLIRYYEKQNKERSGQRN